MEVVMSTTTEIATVGEVSYAALTAGSRQAAILRHNLGGNPMTELDLPLVKQPVHSTTWRFEVNGNEETTDEIQGLLVGTGIRGALWPSEDPTGQRPVVLSHDGIVGYKVSEVLGTIDPDSLERYRTGDGEYDWIALRQSKEFGFDAVKNGGKKRVKESKLLAILRPGEVWPLRVRASAASIGGIEHFIRTLSCFDYEAFVGLRLVREKTSNGVEYTKVAPRLIGTISEEQGEMARQIYYEPLQAMFSARPNGVVSEE
jgi:hypothetical protein